MQKILALFVLALAGCGGVVPGTDSTDEQLGGCPTGQVRVCYPGEGPRGTTLCTCETPDPPPPLDCTTVKADATVVYGQAVPTSSTVYGSSACDGYVTEISGPYPAGIQVGLVAPSSGLPTTRDACFAVNESVDIYLTNVLTGAWTPYLNASNTAGGGFTTPSTCTIPAIQWTIAPSQNQRFRIVAKAWDRVTGKLYPVAPIVGPTF
jgi:hypothetical protein